MVCLTGRREPDKAERCEQCGNLLKKGDRIVFADAPPGSQHRRTGMLGRRYWHTACFNGTLTAVSEWSKGAA